MFTTLKTTKYKTYKTQNNAFFGLFIPYDEVLMTFEGTKMAEHCLLKHILHDIARLIYSDNICSHTNHTYLSLYVSLEHKIHRINLLINY